MVGARICVGMRVIRNAIVDLIGKSMNMSQRMSRRRTRRKIATLKMFAVEGKVILPQAQKSAARVVKSGRSL